MIPRIRSFGAGAPPFAKVVAPHAPQVFREFVAQLEKLAGPAPKRGTKPKRVSRAKTRPRKARKR